MDPNENKLPDDASDAITPEPTPAQPEAVEDGAADAVTPQPSDQATPQTFKPDVQPPSGAAVAHRPDMADVHPATTDSSQPQASSAPMPTEPAVPRAGQTPAPVDGDSVPVAQNMPQPGASIAPAGAAPEPDSSLLPSAATDAPVVVSTPTVGGSGGGNFFTRHKKIWIPAIVAVVLLLAAGGVFGWYLPNQPENVWKTGLERSGQAIETLVTDATNKEKLDAVKMFDVSGNVDIKAGNQGNFSGTISSKIDETHSDSTLTIQARSEGQDQLKLDAKMLTILSDKSQYPDIYFQLNGLSGLGLDAFVPNISSYDGKWIVVSSDYLKSLASMSDKSAADAKYTQEDITDAVNAVIKVSREYVFTADESKAVLVNKEYVGKETVEGVNSYHYKVGFNKDHAADYCQALGNTIADTAIFKQEIAKADRAGSQEEFIKACQDGVKEMPSDAKFDMWVGGHYKLIHKIRVSDPDKQNSYVDFGQTYKGDENISLFLVSHDPSAKTDVNVTTKINTDTYASSTSLNFKTTSSSDPLTGTVRLEIKPSNGHVKVTKPTGAVPLQSVLEQFGIPALPDTTGASAAMPEGTSGFSGFDVTEG